MQKLLVAHCTKIMSVLLREIRTTHRTKTNQMERGKGYELDTTLHTVNVTAGQTATFTSVEPLMNDPVGITIQKMDADGNTVGPEGFGSLAGAQFTVKYYAVDPSSVNKASDLSGQAATRTWVLQTKYNAISGIYGAMIRDDYWISGDAFYYQDGMPIVPHGVITIQETKAPTGYTLDNAYTTVNGEGIAEEGGIALVKIENLWNVATVTTSNGLDLGEDNAIAVKEQVIRGGVKIEKRDSETGKNSPQGGAGFEGTTIQIISMNANDVVVDGKTYGNGQVVKTITLSLNVYLYNAKASATPVSECLVYGLGCSCGTYDRNYDAYPVLTVNGIGFGSNHAQVQEVFGDTSDVNEGKFETSYVYSDSLEAGATEFGIQKERGVIRIQVYALPFPFSLI